MKLVYRSVVWTAVLLPWSVLAQPQPSPAPAAHDTCPTAIALEAPSHSEGVKAEYVWLRTHYGDHKILGQQLGQCANQPIDRFELRAPDGRTVVVLFNLANYWGRGLDL